MVRLRGRMTRSLTALSRGAMDEIEALRHAERITHAWFSLAVIMDENHNAEVTTRKFSRVKFKRLGDRQAEINCGAIRFVDLDGGTYDLLGMSFEPAGPVRVWMNLGEWRPDGPPRGIEVDAGDTITVSKIIINLPKRKRISK